MLEIADCEPQSCSWAILSYGEERLLNDAKEAGVSGFIIVDLPPEEAIRLRNHCTKVG